MNILATPVMSNAGHCLHDGRFVLRDPGGRWTSGLPALGAVPDRPVAVASCLIPRIVRHGGRVRAVSWLEAGGM